MCHPVLYILTLTLTCCDLKCKKEKKSKRFIPTFLSPINPRSCFWTLFHNIDDWNHSIVTNTHFNSFRSLCCHPLSVYWQPLSTGILSAHDTLLEFAFTAQIEFCHFVMHEILDMMSFWTVLFPAAAAVTPMMFVLLFLVFEAFWIGQFLPPRTSQGGDWARVNTKMGGWLKFMWEWNNQDLT